MATDLCIILQKISTFKAKQNIKRPCFKDKIESNKKILNIKLWPPVAHEPHDKHTHVHVHACACPLMGPHTTYTVFFLLYLKSFEYLYYSFKN